MIKSSSTTASALALAGMGVLGLAGLAHVDPYAAAIVATTVITVALFAAAITTAIFGD